MLAHQIGFGKNLTSHPSVKQKFDAKYNFKDEKVVQDGNLITSQGPGTTFDFALKIVEFLEGKEKVKTIMSPMLLKID